MKRSNTIFVIILVMLISSAWPTAAALPSFIETIGSPGTENGQFDGPHEILLVNDRFYVSELINDRVQIFDLNWNYISQFGAPGSGNGEFDTPYGMASDGSYIYVADYINNRVQIFNLDGVYVDQFGTSGSATGEFNGPIDLEIDNGRIFVSDYWNDRVQVFNQSTNSYMYTIDGVSGYSALRTPGPLAVHNNILYVVDSLNDTVKLYNADFDLFLDYIKSPVEYDNPWTVNIIGDRIYISHVDDFIEVYDLSRNYLGEIRGDLNNPRDILVKDNSFYVVEYSDDEISHLRLVASPSEVTVNPGEASITVGWSINTDEGITEPEYYRIYRDDGNNTVFLGETTERIFVDFPPDLFTEYEYQIQAVSSLGESELTSSASVSVHEPEITETDEDDGSFFDSVPLPVLPILSVLLLMPLLRRYRT